jgi:hypothetical protein
MLTLLDICTKYCLVTICDFVFLWAGGGVLIRSVTTPVVLHIALYKSLFFDNLLDIYFRTYSTIKCPLEKYYICLLMKCISPSWFNTQDHVLRQITFQSEANYWQKSWCFKQCYNESRSRSSIRKLYRRYNELVCDYKLSWMICFISFARLSFSYWLWRIPYT